jgi:hypothetical protein
MDPTHASIVDPFQCPSLLPQDPPSLTLSPSPPSCQPPNLPPIFYLFCVCVPSGGGEGSGGKEGLGFAPPLPGQPCPIFGQGRQFFCLVYILQPLLPKIK